MLSGMPSWNETFERMASCWMQAKTPTGVTVYSTTSLVTAFLKCNKFVAPYRFREMLNMRPCHRTASMDAWEELLACYALPENIRIVSSEKHLYAIYCIDDDSCGRAEGQPRGGSTKRMGNYPAHKVIRVLHEAQTTSLPIPYLLVSEIGFNQCLADHG